MTFYKQLPIRAVFVDFDGTLADTMPILYDIYLQFLQKRGISGKKEEFKKLTGNTLFQIATVLKETYKLPESAESLHQEYEELLHKEYLSHTTFFPYAIETLKFIKKELEYPLVLVTAAPSQLVQQILEKNKLKDLFKGIVGGENITKGKPDPEIYLKALQLMKMKPESVLALEDSINGYESALQAGLYCILLLNGNEDTAYNVRREWELPEKLFVMRDWEEAQEFFNALPLLSESDFYD